MSFDVAVIPDATLTGFVPKKGGDQEEGIVAEKLTWPPKPFRLVIDIVEFEFVP